MRNRRAKALVERVESRILFAAFTFDIVQAESTIALAGTVTVTPATGSPSTQPIQSQASGSLSQSFTGTVATNITGSTIRFVGGSDIIAGSDPGDFTPAGTLPQANYAGKIISLPLPVIGAADVFFAVRNARFDLTSNNRTMNASGQFPSAGMTIQPLQGSVRYSAGLLSGQESLVGQSLTSTSPANSSLTVVNGVARLQLSSTMSITQAIAALGSNVNGTINLSGNIVAIARTGSLKGTIFNDVNGNGVKDSGDAGLGTRIVYIDADNDGVKDATEATATTNSQGVYLFPMLAGGTYNVRLFGVTAPSRLSVPYNGVHVASVTNQQVVTKDFGVTTLAPGRVSGTVWNDINADTIIKPGEARIASTTVYIDTDNDSVLDTGERSTTTDANGFYNFDNLPTNINLNIRRNLPAGSFYSTITKGSAHVVNLTPSQYRQNVNFGQTTLKGIRGTVYRDLNDNGAQDSGETGISGVTVWIDTDKDGVKDAAETSLLTGTNGEFRIIVPAGNRVSEPTAGFHSVIYTTNTLTSANFGLTTKARISGIVFQAFNTNGVRDANEPLLGGRTVYIDLDLDGVKDSNEPSTVSSSGGPFVIANLAAGNYRVRIIPASSDGPVTPAFYNITLAAGQIVSTVQFGLIDL